MLSCQMKIPMIPALVHEDLQTEGKTATEILGKLFDGWLEVEDGFFHVSTKCHR